MESGKWKEEREQSINTLKRICFIALEDKVLF